MARYNLRSALFHISNKSQPITPWYDWIGTDGLIAGESDCFVCAPDDKTRLVFHASDPINPLYIVEVNHPRQYTVHCLRPPFNSITVKGVFIANSDMLVSVKYANEGILLIYKGNYQRYLPVNKYLEPIGKEDTMKNIDKMIKDTHKCDTTQSHSNWDHRTVEML